MGPGRRRDERRGGLAARPKFLAPAPKKLALFMLRCEGALDIFVHCT